MHRIWLFFFALLATSATALPQTAASDSQTLQALLTEIRQLRKDLQTTTVISQRVQILIYRMQSQTAVVARAQQHVDEVQAKLSQARTGVQHFTSSIEQSESSSNDSQNPPDRKEIEKLLPRLKAQLESQKAAEQEWESKEAEVVQELRSEQAKLSAFQEQLDQLDKILEQSSRQPVAAVTPDISRREADHHAS